MKLTKETLKRIIKEELDATLRKATNVSEGNELTPFRVRGDKFDRGYRRFDQNSKGDWQTRHYVQNPETGEMEFTYSARGRLDPEFGAETAELNVDGFIFVGERNATGDVVNTSVFQTNNETGEIEFLQALQGLDLINNKEERERYIASRPNHMQNSPFI